MLASFGVFGGVGTPLAHKEAIMNCPRCSQPMEGNKHGDATLYDCLSCGASFFPPEDYNNLLKTLGLDPAVVSGSAEQLEELARTLFLHMFLEPFIPAYIQMWRDVPDEELAECFDRFNSNDDPLLFFDKAQDLIARTGVPDGSTDEELQQVVEFTSYLLAMSLGAEVGQRTNRVHTPEAAVAAKLVRREQVTSEEMAQLLKRGQYRPQGMPRYNPDALDPNSPKTWEEENSSMYLEALLERLSDNPLPDIMRKGGLLRFMQGCLNQYPKAADKTLRARLKTLTDRIEKQEPLDDGALYPVAFASSPDKQVLLAEIRRFDGLSKRERDVVELYLEDCPQKEIAEKLAVTQARVSQLLNSAIKKYQDYLGIA